MKGDLISAVDAADFKRCWAIRQTLVGGSIDLEIFRRSCKPDTDARAAGFRVSALQLLIQMLPGELTGHIKDGQPTEALLKAFAQVPLIEGDALYVEELLRSIKRGV